MAVLNVENLKAYYITKAYGIERTVKAVDNVSLSINENEIFGIAGESGCGKTTLIKALSATIRPPLQISGGSVVYNFNGKKVNIYDLDDEQLRQTRWENISYMPQGSMNVLNPVQRIRKTFKDFVGAHRNIVKDRNKFEQTVYDHLRDLGLPDEALGAYPHQLSGGMKQRVTIALATILGPNVIIADEPTTALDVVVQRGVVQLFKKIQAEQKNTVLMVTHDMAIHANMADRLAIMYAGRIVEEAKVDDIFFAPAHPYTQYLIGSLPEIGDKSYKVSAPGAPPNLAEPPAGCRFHPRCPEAKPECKEQMPELVTIGEGHKVACFLDSGDANNE